MNDVELMLKDASDLDISTPEIKKLMDDLISRGVDPINVSLIMIHIARKKLIESMGDDEANKKDQSARNNLGWK